MPGNLPNPLLHLQIRVIRNSLQNRLYLGNLLRRNVNRDPTPVKDITKRKPIVIGDDKGDASDGECRDTVWLATSYQLGQRQNLLRLINLK
ncbi:hypothetical protein ACOSP7_008474 [Xanthoceras sorbifolium]